VGLQDASTARYANSALFLCTAAICNAVPLAVGGPSVLKVRESLVGQRALLVNALRGHAAEFGVAAGKGLA
jgi:transposase